MPSIYDKLILYFENDYDSIIVHYIDNSIVVIPYHEGLEEDIINEMINQYQDPDIFTCLTSRDSNKSLILFGFNLSLASLYAFLIVNYFISNSDKKKSSYLLLYFVWLLYFILKTLKYCNFKKNDNKRIIKTIKKMRCFIQNEEIINYDIKKYFDEFQKENHLVENYEPNYMTINDVNNYSLEDLKEMVENINNSINDENITLKKDITD